MNIPIGATIGALVGAVIYFLTRMKEREAEWLKLSIGQYREKKADYSGNLLPTERLTPIGKPFRWDDNRAELWLTALGLIEVLQEHADQITIQPPGLHKNGIDFELHRRGCREYHAIRCWKRDVKMGETTRLPELFSKGIIDLIVKKLSAGANRFHLACYPWSYALHEWIRMAASASDAADFQQKAMFAEFNTQTKSSDLMKAFRCRSPEDLFDRLRRLQVKGIFDVSSLQSRATMKSALSAFGLERELIQLLIAHAVNSVGRPLDSSELQGLLRETYNKTSGAEPDAALVSAVESANDRFLQSHRQAFFRQPDGLGKQIDDIVQIVEAPDSPGPVIMGMPRENQRHQWVQLTGKPGSGKSSLMVALTENLALRHLPHLAIRLDRMDPVADTRALGQQLGMAGSPVSALAVVACGRNCALLLDEIDTVCRFSTTSELTNILRTLYEEADVFPNIRIVVSDIIACGFRQIAVEVPDDETILQTVLRAGFDPKTVTKQQILMLRNPLMLCLLERIAEDVPCRPIPFGNRTQLIGGFWKKKLSDCERRGVSSGQCIDAVYRMCEEMDQRGTFFVPETALEGCREAARVLTDEGVIELYDGQWSFFHEAFYTFFNAERNFRNAPLVESLRPGSEHELAKQMLQGLQLRRDYNFDRYCADLEEVLHNRTVAAPVKAAAVRFLHELENPTAQEWNIVMRLLDRTDGALAQFGLTGGKVIELFGTSLEWFQLAVDSGAIQRWEELYYDDVDSFFSYMLFHTQRRFPHVIKRQSGAHT